MASRKVSTTRRRIRGDRRTREARVDNLVRLAAIAYAPVVNVDQAHNVIREFLKGALPGPYRVVSRASAEDVQWIRDAARRHLELTADKATWWLSGMQLVEQDSQFKFEVSPLFGSRGPGVEGSNLKALFLWALAHILGGSQGRRVSRCEEPGCRVVIIRRKRGAYCEQHRTPKERQRRSRAARKAASSLQERRKKRHRRYRVQSGRKRTKMRPIRADELLREVAFFAVPKTSQEE